MFGCLGDLGIYKGGLEPSSNLCKEEYVPVSFSGLFFKVCEEM